MEPLTGVPTNAGPYILASFGLGALCLVGFMLWVLWERRQLRQLLSAVKQHSNN